MKLDERLKATFRHNPHNHKNIYPKSSCVLLVSVGQQYHEGESLEAIVDCINQSRFKFCYVVLGDFIQRYTLQILKGISAPEARVQSIVDGEQWLSRNQKILQKLLMPSRIFRWKEWLMNSHFEDYYSAVKAEFLTSAYYQEEFEKSADGFLSRAHKTFPA